MFDPWKRRRRFFENDPFFEDLDEWMEDIMKQMRQSMENAPDVEGRKGPFVYGYSVRVGPDGEPHVERFGNVSPKSRQVPSGREPLTDVVEGDDQLSVIAELPGIEKQDIDLSTGEQELEINVNTAKRNYHKNIRLPCDVDPDSAKASYKNGVLEVKLDRREKKKPDKKRVDIE
ncbi:MAG: Hsp20 family protein [Candidatus Altiarchaeales archaeon]|nr:Hsp20 family protein [Candidatus Altiarchaeales archaeon]